MSITELRILSWMCGRIRKDKIRNEYTKGAVGVVQIKDKIMENRFRWYVHVQQRFVRTQVRKGIFVCVKGGKEMRGTSKMTWML